MSAINSLNALNNLNLAKAGTQSASATARAAALNESAKALSPAAIAQSIMEANQTAKASAINFSAASFTEAQRGVVSRFWDLQALAQAKGGFQVQA